LREQITFDGPAASGKSTLAKNVAKELGAFFINTGDMYRTLTWSIRQRGINIATEKPKIVELLDIVNICYNLDGGEPVLFCEGKKVDQAEIRSHVITENVSLVASIPEVRHWLVARQRASADLGLLVMEGRDIGTVVFPKARYKFFVTASPEVRAKRRLSQNGEVPEGATIEKVARDIARRDELDMNRSISPLKQADDAVYVDTSEMNIEDATAMIIKVVKEKQNAVHA
jgi:cytidylate kinase